MRRTATGNPKNGMTWAQLLAPPRAGVEGVERRLAGFGVLGAIDRPQFAGDRLAILLGSELHGMADQMHDAGLHHGVWKDGVDRLRKALQPVDHSNENIADAAVLEFVHDTQPELGAFGGLDP